MGALPGIGRHGDVPSTYPRSQIHGISGTVIKEVGHRVVGGAAIGAGEVGSLAKTTE